MSCWNPRFCRPYQHNFQYTDGQKSDGRGNFPNMQKFRDQRFYGWDYCKLPFDTPQGSGFSQAYYPKQRQCHFQTNQAFRAFPFDNFVRCSKNESVPMWSAFANPRDSLDNQRDERPRRSRRKRSTKKNSTDSEQGNSTAKSKSRSFEWQEKYTPSRSSLTVQLIKVRKGSNGQKQKLTLQQDFNNEKELEQFLKDFEAKIMRNKRSSTNCKRGQRRKSTGERVHEEDGSVHSTNNRDCGFYKQKPPKSDMLIEEVNDINVNKADNLDDVKTFGKRQEKYVISPDSDDLIPDINESKISTSTMDSTATFCAGTRRLYNCSRAANKAPDICSSNKQRFHRQRPRINSNNYSKSVDNHSYTKSTGGKQEQKPTETVFIQNEFYCDPYDYKSVNNTTGRKKTGKSKSIATSCYQYAPSSVANDSKSSRRNKKAAKPCISEYSSRLSGRRFPTIKSSSSEFPYMTDNIDSYYYYGHAPESNWLYQQPQMQNGRLYKNHQYSVNNNRMFTRCPQSNQVQMNNNQLNCRIPGNMHRCYNNQQPYPKSSVHSQINRCQPLNVF